MKILSYILLFIWSTSSFAASEIYSFPRTEQQARFENLTHELRCLVCQNQTIADSNAPLAQDLRKVIATMITQDIPSPQILDFLTQRYGRFILYNPPFINVTYLLWLGPFGLLILGLGVLFFNIKTRKGPGPQF